MICYRDMAFCADECGNMECPRNNKHIPPVTELPVCYAHFKENCKKYKQGENTMHIDINWLNRVIATIKDGVANKIEKDNIIVYKVKNIIRIDIKES